MSDYLVHHGIKGQRWGVRNGPPYPLKESAYSKSEKSYSNSKPKVSSGKMGVDPDIVAMVATYVATFSVIAISAIASKASHDKRVKKYYEEHKKALEKEMEKVSDIKYSDIKHVSNNAVVESLENRENEKVDEKTGLHLKSRDMSEDEDMAAVNPEFKSYNYAKVNCGLCTVAYDIRRRGYDVMAGYADDGIGANYYSKYYPGSIRNDIAGDYIKSALGIGKRVSKEECNSVMEKLGKDKNSRGAIFVTWHGYNSGHAMAYEVDSSGKVIIRDAQSNKSYTGDKAIKLLHSTGYIGTVRLDNVEPNFDAMRKDGIIR